MFRPKQPIRDRLRVYSPHDALWFPGKRIARAGAVYIPDKSFIATVVREHTDNSLGYPVDVNELAWATPEEVRLLAAISLCNPEGAGYTVFAPGPSTLIHEFVESGKPLSAEGCIEVIVNMARQLAKDSFGANEPGELCTDGIWGGENVEEEFQKIYGRIKPLDHLTLRGLYCLLKARHLMRHFPEEALMNLHISYEAAEMIFLKHFKRVAPAEKWSKKDVRTYLRDKFRWGDAMTNVLVELHMSWLEMKHPNQDDLPIWCPPHMMDDVFELNGILTSIYRHILLGELGRATAEF